MERNNQNYFYKKMPDKNFVVDIFKKSHNTQGTVMNAHWHEHLQFFYFIKGSALLRCNSKEIQVCAKDFIVINSNELHYMKSLCNNLTYYVFRIDLSFLFSNQADSCQTKFMTPLANNLISFKNLVRNNTEITKCSESIIKEYFSKEIGFELAIKSYILKLIVILLRNYIEKIYTKKQFDFKVTKLKQIDNILKYIQSNFTKKITINELANLAHISNYHFCRLFKQSTGKTVMEYINDLRLRKAILLLKDSTLNITEIALSCGFNDANYFSRVFKNNIKMSPSQVRKN